MDFTPVYDLRLTFGPSISSHSIPIMIVDDAIFEEENETFSVTLMQDIHDHLSVNLTTSLAKVYIKDNDSEQLHADNQTGTFDYYNLRNQNWLC